MTPIPRDTSRPTATRRKPPIHRPRPVPERTLLHTLADVLAARPELARDPRPRATPTREDHPMSTADHATCCCTETLTDLRALKAAVILLHRDEEKTPDILALNIEKHRHGRNDLQVELRWEAQFARLGEVRGRWQA